MLRKMGVLVVLYLMAFLFIGCGAECENTIPPGQPIAIAKPCNDARVGWRTIVKGKVSDPKATVQVIIHPLEVNDHWVQPKIDVSSDGTWQVLAYFGRDGSIDAGKPYEVMAVVNPKTPLKEADVLPDWPEAEAKSDIIRVSRK